MKHYIIYPRSVPEVEGDSNWECPQDFLTREQLLAPTYNLPAVYIEYENAFVNSFYSISKDLLVGEIEIYYLYVYLEDEAETALERMQHKFLFGSSGYIESQVNELVKSQEINVEDLKMYTKLAIRGLGGFCFVDKSNKFVASSTNTGQNFFVSTPSDYDLNCHLSGTNLVFEDSIDVHA